MYGLLGFSSVGNTEEILPESYIWVQKRYLVSLTLPEVDYHFGKGIIQPKVLKVFKKSYKIWKRLEFM